MGPCLSSTCETQWGETQNYNDALASGEGFPELLSGAVQLHIPPPSLLYGNQHQAGGLGVAGLAHLLPFRVKKESQTL